jgi:hypothetical protein
MEKESESNIIYSNDYLKIIEGKKSIFTIEFTYSNQIIINSLIKTRIIQGAAATNNYKTIKFKAQSVISLKQFQESNTIKLPINIISQMIANLACQLNYLISEESCTILGYAPENIIVINYKKFAFLGSEFVSKIEENNNIQISYPFTSSDFFISPELCKITTIPSYVHYKTSYFSLGCLVLYALSSDDNFYKEYLNVEKETNETNCKILIDHLNSLSIKNTKIYWLLLRCLVEEPENRSILFI